MPYSIFEETMVEMAWPEVEKLAQENPVVLLPIGVIEEHGPHMSLGVDTYCSYLTCRLTKRELEARRVNTLIAPPYYWGINSVTGSFPGSFTVRRNTMKAILYDILASLKRWGIMYVFCINWHGDHEHNITILEAVEEARFDNGIRAYCVIRDLNAKRFGLTGNEPHVIIWKSVSSSRLLPGYPEIHAGANETGIMAKYFPDQVNTEVAKGLKSTDLSLEDLAVWRRGWSDARQMTPLGYFGDPASLDPEASKEFMEIEARSLAELITAFTKGNYGAPTIE